MSRRTVINLVFFLGVFFLMLGWAARNIITIEALENPYEISGRFEASVGVAEDSEVTYLGVNYGYVDSVERVPGAVEIAMKIHKGKQIPAGSTARVFRKSAVGEPYIDFVPPEDFSGDDAEMLEPGDHVPMEDTTVPLEFSELLRSASALISSIDPEAAGSLVHELAVGLAGRGDDLRQITTSFDDITRTFSERTELLDRLTENGAAVTHAVAERRGALQSSIESIAAVADTLERSRGNLEVLLEDGTRLLGTTADLISDEKQNLDCLFHDLETIVRLTGRDDKVTGLRDLLQKGPTGFGLIFGTVVQEADGPWVQVHLTLPVGEEPPPQYVPRRTLPQVPTVPVCASSQTPASTASFDLTGAVESATTATPPSSRESMPATGGSAAAALGLMALAGALVSLWARRTPEHSA